MCWVPSRYEPCCLIYAAAVILCASHVVIIWWCDVVANWYAPCYQGGYESCMVFHPKVQTYVHTYKLLCYSWHALTGSIRIIVNTSESQLIRPRHSGNNRDNVAIANRLQHKWAQSLCASQPFKIHTHFCSTDYRYRVYSVYIAQQFCKMSVTASAVHIPQPEHAIY